MNVTSASVPHLISLLPQSLHTCSLWWGCEKESHGSKYSLKQLRYLLHILSKLKLLPFHAMKTYGCSRDITPIINLSTKQGCAISLTLHLLYLRYPPNRNFGRQHSNFWLLQREKMFCIFRDSNTGSSSFSLVATLTALCRLPDEKLSFV